MNLHTWLSKQEVSPLQWKVAMQVHNRTEQHTHSSVVGGLVKGGDERAC